MQKQAKILYTIIAILFVINIAFGLYIFLTHSKTNTAPTVIYTGSTVDDTISINATTTTTTGVDISNNVSIEKPLEIELIGDKRVNYLDLEDLEKRLLATYPSLASATITKKDFSDEEVQNFMKKNNLNSLPAIIFSTKNFDNSQDKNNIKIGLQELSDQNFLLPVDDGYNPFLRDENGFLGISIDNIPKILENGYFKGDKNGDIVILEYSDLQCPACQQFYQTGYFNDILEGTSGVSILVQHFPLDNLHNQARSAAELLECFADQKGAEGYYALNDVILTAGNTTEDFILSEAEKLGADRAKMKSCFTEGTFQQKVDAEQRQGDEFFDIQHTPTIIILNKKTGKYDYATRYVKADKNIIESLRK